MAETRKRLEPEEALGLMSQHPIASLLNSSFHTGLIEALRGSPIAPTRFAEERTLRKKTVELLLHCLQHLGIVSSTDAGFVLTSEWKTTFDAHYDVFEKEAFYGKRWDDVHRIVAGIEARRSFEDDLFGKGEGLADYLVRVKIANEPHAVALMEKLDPIVKEKGLGQLLDVGGGHALYSETMLRRHPNMNAAVCDLPLTVQISKEMNRDSPVGDRLRFIEGDARALPELPFTPDLVFVNDLLHSFDFEEKRKVAKSVVAKLAPGGVLAVTKVRYSPVKGDVASAFFSMRLNLHSEGRGYLETDEECEAVFAGEPLRLIARYELAGLAQKTTYVYERI